MVATVKTLNDVLKASTAKKKKKKNIDEAVR